ncbi:MAG: hypothetical protein A2Z20_02715 [Bdellovibrionales bacterium RBG_16_40_8]|nr:MAG: hypothetical protein A2Z20_02715 [Bdellovibrionales bacterium RBG_16_40_8]
MLTFDIKTKNLLPPHVQEITAKADFVLYFYNGIFLSNESKISKHASLTVQPVVSTPTSQNRRGAFVRVAKPDNISSKIVTIHMYDNALSETESLALPISSHNTYFFDKHSRAEIFEAHIAKNTIECMVKNATDFVLDQGAQVIAAQVILSDLGAIVENQVKSQQKENSYLQLMTCSLGGKAIRNDISFDLSAQGVSTDHISLNIAGNSSNIINSTVINHEVESTKSEQICKNIVQGSAHIVFNGRLIIAQDAQKSDAKQSVQSLILSDSASVDVQPQLEIFADDVKAAHGATVGQIDAEELFYLQSRGISRELAEKMISQGFQHELMSKVKSPFVKQLINSCMQGAEL